jgi:ribosomal protein L16 Arg81 hydroxylase
MKAQAGQYPGQERLPMAEPIEIMEADGARRPVFESFDSLIHPKSRDEFFGQHWETKPFVLKRNIPGFFDEVLALADVDLYLGTRAFHEPDIRIVKNGKDSKFDDYAKGGIADRAKVMQQFRDGAMLVLSHMNRHHLPLAELLSRCEAQTHVPMRSNVYLSPPNSRGFKLHWDTHDVLILQISGSKRWHLYDSPFDLPHEDQKRRLKKRIDEANKLTEVVLEPGSVLFLPRGFVHGAESENEHSLHITIGLRSLTIGDVILRAFRRDSLLDPEMRKIALLDDFSDEARQQHARTVLRRVIENMDIEAAANDVYRSFIRSRQPPVRGALMDTIKDAGIGHEERMRVRADALFQTFRNEDGLSLAVDGVVVKFPSGVEEAIDYVRTRKEFTPGSLPGLEHESKLILARALLECRLVELAG